MTEVDERIEQAEEFTSHVITGATKVAEAMKLEPWQIITGLMFTVPNTIETVFEDPNDRIEITNQMTALWSDIAEKLKENAVLELRKKNKKP